MHGESTTRCHLIIFVQIIFQTVFVSCYDSRSNRYFRFSPVLVRTFSFRMSGLFKISGRPQHKKRATLLVMALVCLVLSSRLFTAAVIGDRPLGDYFRAHVTCRPCDMFMQRATFLPFVVCLPLCNRKELHFHPKRGRSRCG